MSMMAYPSFLKVITGCLSWGRGSDSQAAPPLWRVTAAALDVRASAARRTAGNRRQENERAAMERERKGAMPPTPTTISSAFLLPDAFSLDPYLAWFT